MRVLFVPCHEGGIAHQIPLLALNRMLSGRSIEAAFLVPRVFHKFLRLFGTHVLNIDHNSFRTEVLAATKFSPDVVVDDFGLFTGVASVVKKLPRVAIQRTGMFAGSKPRNENHKHSSKLDVGKLPDLSFLELPQPKALSDLFEADVKIVPGIRSIELLPARSQNDPSYVFSGPLLIDDYMVGHLNQLDERDLSLTDLTDFNSLRRFFDLQKDRKVVYATFGTVAEATEPIREAVRSLINAGIAVASNIQVEGLRTNQRELYYYAKYLPMHFVCSRVDVMIHHCGSGTYHYPILHNTPTITIGTKCYDRDDVATRLEELGVSVHIPSPDECPNFVATLQEAIEKYFDSKTSLFLEKKKNLALLNAEIKKTSSSFNFERVLERVVS